MLGTAIVIGALIVIGTGLGWYMCSRQYRERPTNDQLRFATYIYQKKSDDYKALCLDARTQAEALSLLAAVIHQNNPSEASSKIIAALDHFIVGMNNRLAAKQFTPADGIDGVTPG